MKAEAGITGPDVRSDCYFRIELKTRGGLQMDIHSKVEAMYGQDIRRLVDEGLRFFGIRHAMVILEDQGALPFVIMARMEAAIRKTTGTDKEWLPEMLKACTYPAIRERVRFSRLYLPGNTPKMMINAGIHHPHAIILDLEDSVAPDKKPEARTLVRNALRSIDFFGAERMVRINQLPLGLDDLSAIVPHNVHLVLVPKCENADQVKAVEAKVNQIRKEKKMKHDVFYMPIIESALGVENAFVIASSSPNVVALAIGLEDYSADLGVMRTREAHESFYARTRLVNACKAAGIQAIDSVFSDVADDEGLRQTIRVSKSLGFEGMGCIHPSQIEIIHQGYAPAGEEIEKAKKIVNAYLEARRKGLGVVSLGTKMIDAPVVKRAEKVIDLALKFGLISKNWRTGNGKK
jgi:citrate lyase subunit beta/citryl-CoA lyase